MTDGDWGQETDDRKNEAWALWTTLRQVLLGRIGPIGPIRPICPISPRTPDLKARHWHD